MGCIVNKYVSNSGKECKHSHQWLAEFISSEFFLFTCSTCLDSKKIAGNNMSNITANFQEDVAGLKSTMLALATDVKSIAKEISALKDGSCAFATKQATVTSDLKSAANSCSPVTYAAAVSHNLSDTMKKVIVDTMNDRDRAIRDNMSATFYNLPERKQDHLDVSSVLKAMSVQCVPTSCIRLGRPAASSITRPRPVKVMFNSTSDRDMVLRATKNLKASEGFKNLRVGRFRSKDEMEKEKEVRAQCKQLNDGAKVDSTGKKPYVVIDGKIMVAHNGKLQLLNEGGTATAAKNA
jgi:hypothetical protein